MLRPTFHESWHRVDEVRPRLRASLSVHRQHYRGRRWHVVQDPANNQFFRLSDAAYRFVALLDGRRTVDEAWRLCAGQLGDEAPTQGEVIQLLGHLYSSNLLYAEVAGDVEAMFRRQRLRRHREIRGQLTNLLFVRIPLWDPDRFLGAWVGAFGWLFSRVGLALWMALMVVAAWALAGRAGELAAGAGAVLAPANLPLLYAAFVVTKLLHELGHGFACKKFGREGGAGGGEVHVLGVMLLLFVPVPYVDASSAWAFKDKWRRIVVGAAGMFVELAVAAAAAIVWANTSAGSASHALAYNVMFIAGVSTVLFNANPLLRYDGYYILSDLLETPNLAQRSRDYIYYLVKRRVWGLKRAVNPAQAPGEAPVLAVYGVASFIYRTAVYAAIILFISGQLFIVGVVMALGAVFGWLVAPLGKFLKFLATSPEIARVRPRAIWTTAAGAGAAALVIGVAPFPDRVRAEGVVEPARFSVVYMGADGFIDDATASGARVAPGGALVRASNAELEASLAGIAARRKGLAAQRRRAMVEDPALGQIVSAQIEAADEQIARIRAEVDALVVTARHEGVWISPDIDRARGAFLARGETLGMVADVDRAVVRAVAPQTTAALLRDEAAERVEMRVRGRADAMVGGVVTRYMESGQRRLPSAALGFGAGGAMEVDPADPEGLAAVEPFFEVLIEPDEGAGMRLLPGQRVVVRFELRDRPLLEQWGRSLRQVFQRRLRMSQE